MTPRRWQEVKRAFEQARALPHAEREEFLKLTSAANPELGACATDLQIPGQSCPNSAESKGMGQIFEPYEPDQAHLFPASPKDWLPDGHLAFFVSDTVDELDVEPFVAT